MRRMAAGQVVAPVTGRITRPPFVELGESMRAGAAVLDVAVRDLRAARAAWMRVAGAP